MHFQVYERFINDSMLPIIQTFLSNYVSAYRKHYSANNIESYKNHPSVVTMKENVLPCSLSFDSPPAGKKDINKILRSLNASKETEPDGIPLKLIKLSANVTDRYLTGIINYAISRSYFSDGGKNALVRPTYKKKDRQYRENHHPVSILNAFSSL